MLPDALELINDAGESTPRYVQPGNFRVWATGVAGKSLRVELCNDYDPANGNPGTWIAAHPDMQDITDDFIAEPLIGHVYIRMQPNGGNMVGVKAYAIRSGGRR